MDYEIERTLADLDLTEKADFVSANLSGGQKRKLCIGIAIIGDPKVHTLSLLILIFYLKNVTVSEIVHVSSFMFLDYCSG